MRATQKIRYILEYDGKSQVRAQYNVGNLEDSSLIDMMYHIGNDDINVVRRDLGTGMFTTLDRREVFENDKVKTEDGIIGYVRKKPGGFYLKGAPLGNYTIEQVLKY